MKKRKPKIFWIILTSVITALAVTLYFILAPTDKKLRYQIDSPSDVKSAHFSKILGDLMGPPFREGNGVKTLLNGNAIFPAMLTAIGKAQRTITFESYIYWSGDIGSQFVEALSARARAGVKVHVLLDWVGSDRIKDDYIEKMKSAGVEVERYHEPAWHNLGKMNNRTHRKILVVDGKVGFTGGVGIADEWNGDGLDPGRWRDTHYEVRGPVVAQMQAAFLDNWMKVRPEVHQSKDYFPELSNVEKASENTNYAQMFKSSSREGSSSVHIMYLLTIAAAKESIYLESAYFVPDEVTIAEIVKARRRGVRVEIIVPGELTDSHIVRHASRESWDDLLNAGVKIFEYSKAMFHCKVLVVDEYFVSVGSTNFDERSFNLNDEANLNVLGQGFAREQIKTFEVDRGHSKEITFETWKNRPASHKLFEKFAVLLRSQL